MHSKPWYVFPLLQAATWWFSWNLRQFLQVDSSSFFTPSPINFTRGHDYKLLKFRSKLLTRHNFFTNRVIDQWNGLPDYVVNAQTLNEFKNKLDMFWAENGYGHQERPKAYWLLIIILLIIVTFLSMYNNNNNKYIIQPSTKNNKNCGQKWRQKS